MDLYAGTIMDVKKINYQIHMQVLQWMKKTNSYLRDLYAGIAMDVKKLITIYETYMWVLHI